jgi:hypothetical protein
MLIVKVFLNPMVHDYYYLSIHSDPVPLLVSIFPPSPDHI